MHLFAKNSLGPAWPHVIGASAGVLLILGLWTPIAGGAVAAIEIWTALAWPGNPLLAVTLASLGATLAMIGPGVWSIDAQLYGRKHIEPSRL